MKFKPDSNDSTNKGNDLSTRFERTKVEILRLGQLPEGWDYGRGLPATKYALVHSTLIVDTADNLGVKSVEAFPDPEGGILLILKRDGGVAEILCYSHGDFDLLIRRQDGEETYFDELSYGELKSKLEGLGWKAKRSYASYTRDISIQKTADSYGQRSRIRLVEASQLSTASVPKQLQVVSANTSGDSIRSESLVTLQYTGDYKPPNYHLTP